MIINFIDFLMKIGQKRAERQKMDNNKLIEDIDGALDFLEGLQHHADERIKNAAFRLISENFEQEDE